MTHRIALLSAALLLPTSAHAIGVGTSYAIGNDFAALAGAFGGNNNFVLSTSMGFLPSLDLHPGNATIQIHVLETLSALTDEDFFLGANAYFNVVQSPNSGSIVGVVEPGFGVDLWVIQDFAMAITGECRFGLMGPGEASFGVYAVPALGVAITENDTDIVIAGTLQFSVWFGS